MITKKILPGVISLAALGVTSAGVVPGVFADEAKKTTIEEVVVTARGREESIQDAPVAVTGFNSAMIEDADINRMEDFLQLTPNVTLATSQGIGTSFMTIRGLTQVRNGESPVAILIDGVPQFNARQFRQELFNIQNIQVVKGPQGAIYGRNAAGGAIIIDTKAPSNERTGSLQLGIGDGDERSAGLSLGGALVEDSLYGSIDINHVDRDGYLDNLTRNTEDDPFEDTSFRGRLVWDVSENLRADFIASYSEHEGRGVGFQFQGVGLEADGITGTFEDFTDNTGAVDADNVVDIRSNNPDVGDRETLSLSLKLDWDLDFGTFTSITAYNELEDYTEADGFPYTAATNTGNPAVFGFDATQNQYVDVEGWYQEFKLSSDSEQRLRWNIGMSYLTWDRFISSTTGDDTGQGILRVEKTPTTDPRNPTNAFFADDNDNTAWAVYGQINYDATDNLELSAALRYDEEEREQDVSLFNTGGIPGAKNKETFDAWQPKFTARYSISDETNIYATWGVGFRSGQFNQNGVGEVAAEAGLVGIDDLADQEDSESFEIGLKTSLLDDRLRINAALFDTTVEGQHYFVFIGAVGAQVLVNIDEVSLRGGEIDAIYRVNDYLDVYTAYGYTDSEIDEYNVNPAAEGNDAPYIPESTFNLGAQLRVPVSEATNLFARVDYELRGSQYWDPENTTDRSDLELINAVLGIEGADGKWSLKATVDNITDEKYNSEWVAGGFSAAAPGRIWGVDLTYKFF
ncbi:MAG: TonB-dependent receptor [bacterium]